MLFLAELETNDLPTQTFLLPTLWISWKALSLSKCVIWEASHFKSVGQSFEKIVLSYGVKGQHTFSLFDNFFIYKNWDIISAFPNLIPLLSDLQLPNSLYILQIQKVALYIYILLKLSLFWPLTWNRRERKGREGDFLCSQCFHKETQWPAGSWPFPLPLLFLPTLDHSVSLFGRKISLKQWPNMSQV